ncbi:MAG: M56 family metallopeptidase [Flavobacteriaceae bacterium]|nr:M56 family metallopeptidase [Flavobacteriaceae bacterium]
MSFIIPLLKFESLQQTIPQDYVILLPEVVLNPQKAIERTSNSIETFNYLNILFYIGIAVVTILFLIKLTRIVRLIISNNVIKKENYTLILLNNQPSAFSFFKYIFIDKTLAKKEELNIIEHELVHCKQYHTADLIFFELLKILMWFNPMIYIYQKRITLLHEYISDAEVVKESDKKTYFNNLLATTFNVENISFVNQFYKHSLIKKRIIMITKEKSQKMKQLKYLVLVPLLASMLFYTSCTNEDQQLFNEVEKELLKGDEITEGKYFRPKNGSIVLFIGKSLKGEVVPFEEYTDKEKEMYDRMDYSVKETGSKMEFQVVINEEGERVLFVKLFKRDRSETRLEIEEYGENVSFAVIDNVPQFPGCTGDNQSLKDCLNRSFQEHVQENFNVDIAKNLGLSGKQKIYVQFKITKTGDIEILGARAPKPELETEAKRVINSLPRMIPGEHNGEKVNVIYMLPISFNVE